MHTATHGEHGVRPSDRYIICINFRQIQDGHFTVDNTLGEMSVVRVLAGRGLGTCLQ